MSVFHCGGVSLKAMSRLACAVFLVLLLFAANGLSFAQSGNETYDERSKLEMISSNNLNDALDALDELLHSKDSMTRSRALEEAFKSKERRIREAGYKYFLSNIKQFVVEFTVPESKYEEMEKLGNSTDGDYKRLPSINSLICEIEKFDANNLFEGKCSDLGGIAGNIAGGRINIKFNSLEYATMNFSDVASGYMIGTFNIPHNSFVAKIPLP